ncbi:MAG: sigma-70 family RNA polymerase sigma factor [Planctomycetes bacterium]|nr:sigma-70 family RNA polymerase sigma factor [Planctomycetota bacterium]
MPTPQDVTHLLNAFADGDRAASERLLPLIYDELRALAGSMFKSERPGHTLQPTAVVHEAFLRLAGSSTPIKSRAHFLALAAKVMRQLLVDYARAKRAQKRGAGEVTPCALDPNSTPAPDAGSPADVIDLDAALTELAALYPRAASVVELRSFGGLTDDESAAILGVARATVERDWAMARAWLKRRLSEPGAAQP